MCVWGGGVHAWAGRARGHGCVRMDVCVCEGKRVCACKRGLKNSVWVRVCVCSHGRVCERAQVIRTGRHVCSCEHTDAHLACTWSVRLHVNVRERVSMNM